MKRLDAEAQQLIKRLVEEALVRELDEYLGFGRYERTGSAKPAHQHRSGGWTRSLRTMWGSTELVYPNCGMGTKSVSGKYLRGMSAPLVPGWTCNCTCICWVCRNVTSRKFCIRVLVTGRARLARRLGDLA